MTLQEDPHLSLGAYVLHALPPAEEAAFDNHLAGCETCRHEVASLQEATAALATVHSMPVAPHLRAGTLDSITRVSQDRSRRHTRSLGRRALNLVLAASIAAVAALGGTAVWQHSQAEDARSQAAQARSANEALTDVVTASDATLHTAGLTGGAAAAVVVSRGQGSAVFTAQGLPDLTGDKVYELWYAADTGALRPAGLLRSETNQNARLLEGPLAGAVAVGITVEPPGGSRQPSTEPLGIISLTS
ncbi:anti-sigma factor domain-containing protein [Streptomyces sp. NPDC058291]|uniref:anti-sigma factor n=1 Tax=Streptomyces sp. NPDC058291 TaxID=3346427 RepID=UPI0036E99A13